QTLRDLGIAIIREVGVDTGGCNVQFATHPETGRVVVIEMNPRVSRSSALASKATGYPIAKIAARLALGYTLAEITNDITGTTPASFEPALDYVAVKVPRFTFEKFPAADATLTTTMKSVGEAIALGRTDAGARQTALRSPDAADSSFHWRGEAPAAGVVEQLLEAARVPTDHRLVDLQQASRGGATREQIFEATRIDPFFVDQMFLLQQIADEIGAARALDEQTVRRAKRHGFSDRQIAEIRGIAEDTVREVRYAYGLRPVYKTVDTCAGEFPAQEPYFYSSYDAETEVPPREQPAV